MTCETFRDAIRAGEPTAEMLEHLRSCNGCLEAAVAVDPDYLFRSLGGDDVAIPGGEDAFVAEVMHEVHMRSAETRFQRRGPVVAMVYRWAAAAAIAFTAGSTVFLDRATVVPQSLMASHASPAIRSTVMASARPVVENYEASGATIVEVPESNSNSDVKVVMIFDESLPADL